MFDEEVIYDKRSENKAYTEHNFIVISVLVIGKNNIWRKLWYEICFTFLEKILSLKKFFTICKPWRILFVKNIF